MKIVCVGRNYVEHIKELNNLIPDEPVYFIKPDSSISDEIIIPNELMHYEGEISFLIGDKLKVGFGFDFTLREKQKKLKEKGLPWERAKAFKNSAVFSEFVEFDDINSLSLEVYKNNELVQKGSVKEMIYKPEFLLKDIDNIFGLFNGDIVMSGTPKGVGVVSRGDLFEGRIYENDKLLISKSWIVK
jgi:2-keto-4-pentenoate hydratase/2-oxohepta-3-ene-1,7-dioic acid hydratase in catechol pathway